MGAVYTLTLRQLSGKWRLIIMTVLAAMPVVVALLTLAERGAPTVAEFEIIVFSTMLYGSIAPLVVLAIAAASLPAYALIHAELEHQAWTRVEQGARTSRALLEAELARLELVEWRELISQGLTPEFVPPHAVAIAISHEDIAILRVGSHLAAEQLWPDLLPIACISRQRIGAA